MLNIEIQIKNLAKNKTGLHQNSSKDLLFLIYINNLVDGLSSNTNLFADDSSFFSPLFMTQ